MACCAESLNKECDVIENKIDERYKFVDYLSEKIEANESSSSEASVFLSLINELNITYSKSFIEKVKKIAARK
ncbi:hypothetical protein CBG25_17915 [Arsenophonus sp. ENCA]|uniref:hypothetical protein n=1 Tax=Arsenophonus sp. ENCA TaxID=1987579 RepID=UPI000BC41FEB|nr:hypothetical protein [Arsenophonus sp. ENCA]PAV01227.1 hypothetical protein CBG25_17915 [Arsenophonus sp. ENCA]